MFVITTKYVVFMGNRISELTPFNILYLKNQILLTRSFLEHNGESTVHCGTRLDRLSLLGPPGHLKMIAIKMFMISRDRFGLQRDNKHGGQALVYICIL